MVLVDQRFSVVRYGVMELSSRTTRTDLGPHSRKRITAMESSAARLLKLLSLLQSRPHWSATELADRLVVTTRTVRRDVTRLRDLGYPVEAEAGSNGGYQLGRGGALPPLLLTDDEAVAVAVGLRAAASGGLAGYDEAAVAAMAKLEQVLPSTRARVGAGAGRRRRCCCRPGGEAVDTEVLLVVAQGCRRNERVRFELPRQPRQHHATAASSRTTWSTPNSGGTSSPTTSTATTGARSASTASHDPVLTGHRFVRHEPTGRRPDGRRRTLPRPVRAPRRGPAAVDHADEAAMPCRRPSAASRRPRRGTTAPARRQRTRAGSPAIWPDSRSTARSALPTSSARKSSPSPAGSTRRTRCRGRSTTEK